ncbi:MAG: undecaprenyl-diphosphatase, partial [Clostridiales Family XIII bacterium]|nr:undecaprenyl-diphosphatase [Clostridiales Family XIII bacterium]
MPIWEAIVLGLVQGLAEFLPVSSSGHLALLQHFFGIEGERVLTFTVL